jgi:hypothetical protein
MNAWHALLLGAASAFLAIAPWVPPPTGRLLTALGETLRAIAVLIKP